MHSQPKSDTAWANGEKDSTLAEPIDRLPRNSIKPRITASHSVLLACEDPVVFQRMADEYTAAHQPANIVERDLVEEIVCAEWRIRRMKRIEAGLMDREMETLAKLETVDTRTHLAAAFKRLSTESRTATLLSRYEAGLNRIASRSHQTLMDFRRARADGLMA